MDRGFKKKKPLALGGVVVILDAFPAQNAVMRGVLYVWLELIMPHVARWGMILGS